MTEPDERAPDARFTLANERTLLAWLRTTARSIEPSSGSDQLIGALTVAHCMPPSQPCQLTVWW